MWPCILANVATWSIRIDLHHRRGMSARGRLEMPPAPRQGPHVRVSADGRRGQLSAVAAVPAGGQDSIDHRRVTRQQARQLVARGRQMPPSYASSGPRVRRSAEGGRLKLSAVPAGGQATLGQDRVT